MMKPCSKCRHYSFVGLESTCRKTHKTVGPLQEHPCFEEKASIEINPQTTTAMEEKPKTKVCKNCGHELPLDKFGPHPRSKDGLQAVCRTCASQARKGRRISRHPSENEENCPPPLRLRKSRILTSITMPRFWRNSAAEDIREHYQRP